MQKLGGFVFLEDILSRRSKIKRSGTVLSLKRGEFKIQEKTIIKNGHDKVPPSVSKGSDEKCPSNEGHVASWEFTTDAKSLQA